MIRTTPAVADRLPAMLATYHDGRQFVCPRNDLMYASVLCHGVWEPVESAAIASILRPGDVAFDVGANQGWHSLGMAALVGNDGMVWAVEPVPPIVEDLRSNLARNPHLRVSVLPCALGASPGRTALHVFHGLPDGHASASTLDRDDYERHDVPRRTLDELIAETGSEPAFVKIDVEGSDLDVLLGASELASHPAAPIWLLEVNWQGSRALGYEPPDLLGLLNEAGDYRCYRLTRHGAFPETQPRQAPHGSAWLAVPRQRLHRISLLDPVW